MIQNILANQHKRIKVRAGERLRLHFLALARQISAWQGQDPERVSIGITSDEKKAGTSTVAFNLAAALTHIHPGNVLLIETQFEHPHIGRRIPRPAYGLSDILNSDVPAENCVFPTTMDRLYLLGCGTMTSRDAAGLTFDPIVAMNEELRDDFVFIVYDLPEASDVTHCFPMVQHLDGTILVADASRINEERLNRVRRKIDRLGTDVIGLVLNKSV